MAFGLDDAIAEGLKIVNKFITDPAEKAKAEAEYLNVMTQLKLAQIDLNKAETQNGSWLGKWRGGLGWMLAISATYQLMVQPFIVAVILWITPAFPVEKMPKLEWQELGKLLLGMLGIVT